MPFALVHAGKYRTEDKLKIQAIHISFWVVGPQCSATCVNCALETLLLTKHNPEKANNAKDSKTKLRYPGLVAFYDTRPGIKVDLFSNAPEPTRGSIWYHMHTTNYDEYA